MNILAQILLGILSLFAFNGLTYAQIYVSDFNTNSIVKYNLDGSLSAASFITNLSGPEGVAFSNNVLYVTNYTSGIIGSYNANTGATINSTLISGINGPRDILTYGENLYIVSRDGTIGVYNSSTGAAVGISFSGLSNPWGCTISNGILYAASFNTGAVSTYNATTGQLINSSFITGLSNPQDVAILGNILFVSNYTSGVISKYTTSGTLLDASFITNAGSPVGMDILDGILYVTEQTTNEVVGYDASTGQAVKTLTGLSLPVAVATAAPEPSPTNFLTSGLLLICLAITFKRKYRTE